MVSQTTNDSSTIALEESVLFLPDYNIQHMPKRILDSPDLIAASISRIADLVEYLNSHIIADYAGALHIDFDSAKNVSINPNKIKTAKLHRHNSGKFVIFPKYTLNNAFSIQIYQDSSFRSNNMGGKYMSPKSKAMQVTVKQGFICNSSYPVLETNLRLYGWSHGHFDTKDWEIQVVQTGVNFKSLNNGNLWYSRKNSTILGFKFDVGTALNDCIPTKYLLLQDGTHWLS